MLVELSCNLFRENGRPRGVIELHPGLNVVEGTAEGSNSIGKSTLLMIVDFAFGGDDYPNKCEEVIQEIGHHTIRFAFQFEGVVYRFQRSTDSHEDVFKCNENYQPEKKMTIKEFREFLANMYRISDVDLTLREAVSCFFRIAHRESINKRHPLQTVAREKDKKALYDLLKLMNLYGPVGEVQKALDEEEEKLKSLKGAASHSFLVRAKNQKEYGDNEKKIGELQTRQEELRHSASNGFVNIDSFVAQKIRSCQENIAFANQSISDLEAMLSSIRRDKKATAKKFKNDFDALKKFFPSVDLQQLTEIETFHEQLATALNAEFKEQEQELEKNLDKARAIKLANENEIEELRSEKQPDFSTAVLEEYAKLSTDIALCKKANDLYLQELEIKQRKESYSNTLDQLIQDRRHEVETVVNDKLRELNDMVCGRRRSAPYISVEKGKSLILEVKKDTGTGSRDRGLVLFDIAMLQLTCIPVVVHDSTLMKNIEDSQMLEILKLYTTTEKQVFIAFDKANSYKSDEVSKIIKSHKVISLYPDGGELFGYSWSKE